MAVEASKSESPNTDQPGRGIPADARVRFELLEDCRESVVVQLCKLVGDALARMGEDLATTALGRSDRDEQQSLIEASSVVRQHRANIELSFKKAFIDCFERRLFQKSGEEKPEKSFDGELQLMDDAVFTDKLTVDRLVSKTRGRLDPEEVLGIRARLAALLERDWFEETQHPVAPEAVYEALKSALAEASAKPEIQGALLDAFEPHVTGGLNLVYASVNDRLKARNILPKIKQQVTTVGGAARRSAVPGSAEADIGDTAGIATGQAGGAGGGVGGSAGVMHGAAGGASTGHLADNVGASGRSNSLRPGAGQGANVGATHVDLMQQAELISALNLSMQQLAQGMPSARASVAKFLTDPETFGVADLPLPQVQPTLIESIAHLQIQAGRSPFVDPQLISDISDRARDKGSPLDQLTVDFVSMVFDYIVADRHLADIAKQQLLRLQIVAIKAALLDRSFFARRQHPMRRLIDRISEVASDPDTDLALDGAIVTGLESLIDWILVNFDSDLVVFDEALVKLDDTVASEASRRDSRLSDMTEAAEQIEARAAARDRAKNMLGERIDESTPAFIKEFLVTWWSDAIAAAGTAVQADAMNVADSLKIAEALIWSVVPKVPAEIPKLAALLPKLITGLMRGLKPVEIPKDERESFFNELLRIHTKAIESAKQAKPVQTVAERGLSRVRMRSDGSIMYTPPRAVDAKPILTIDPKAGLSRAVAEVQRGDLIEVDDNGEIKQYKLAWVSPSQKLYILSRFPDEARSLDSGQFAALFASGKAKIVEKRSSVDHAIGQINVPDQSLADAITVPA
jgi:Protein of unknown function (DUF1631)